MAEYIEREAVRDVCERPPITQVIKDGEKSICWFCLHWSVCFAKENQPCIKCSRYIPATDVRPAVRGHWVRKDSIAHGCVMRVCLCSACKRNALINEDGFWELSNFCPNCGADMRGREDERTD